MREVKIRAHHVRSDEVWPLDCRTREGRVLAVTPKLEVTRASNLEVSSGRCSLFSITATHRSSLHRCFYLESTPSSIRVNDEALIPSSVL